MVRIWCLPKLTVLLLSFSLLCAFAAPVAASNSKKSSDPKDNDTTQASSSEAWQVYPADVKKDELRFERLPLSTFRDKKLRLEMRFDKEATFPLSQLKLGINGIRLQLPGAFTLEGASSWESVSDSQGKNKATQNILVVDLDKLRGSLTLLYPLLTLLNLTGHLHIWVDAPKELASGLLKVGGVPATPPAPKKPTVVFDSVPKTPVHGTSVQFKFHSPEGATHFKCRLDDGRWSPCRSPVSLTITKNGSHRFYVKAFSWRVGFGAPVDYHFQIVGKQQDLAITSVDPSSSPINVNQLSVAFRGDAVTCSVDGKAAVACVSPFLVQGLSEGAHTLLLQSGGGQTATYSWVIDTKKPEIQWLGTPAAETANDEALFAFEASETATYRCAIDGAPASSCSSPFEIARLAEGVHSIAVIATDIAGNSSAPLGFSWKIDKTAPEVAVVSTNPSQPVTSSLTLAVSFTTSEPATVSCRLGGMVLENCYSGMILSSLPEGEQVLSLSAKDRVGNVGPEVIYRWTVDRSSPELSLRLVSPAKLPTSSDSATFELSSNEAATFACSLDGAPGTPCENGLTLQGLSEGTHRLTSVPMDIAGNVGNASEFVWEVDKTAPLIRLGEVVPSESVTASTTLQLHFEVSENVVSTCNLDELGEVPCQSPFLANELMEGKHRLVLQASDLAGNKASPLAYEWEVAITATVTLDAVTPSQSPSRETLHVFSFSSSNSSTFECSLDGNPFSRCASPKVYAGVGEGAHLFAVRALNLSQAAGPEVTHAFTVDITGPQVHLAETEPAQSPSKATSYRMAFTASETAKFFCSFDGAAFSPCASPVQGNSLTEGGHIFQVYAVDKLGNAGGTVSYAWDTDLTGPATKLLSVEPSGTPVSKNTLALRFESSEAALFHCSQDSFPAAICTSPLLLSGLSAGAHRVEVRATDSAGNEGAPLQYEWEVDSSAPEVTIESVTPGGSPSSSETLTIAFKASEPASFSCSLDAAVASDCLSPVSLAGLKHGGHTFTITAKDKAGNESAPVTHRWSVDREAPSLSWGAISPSDSPTKTTTLRAEFSASEASTFTCTLDGVSAECTSPFQMYGLEDGARTLSVKAVDSVGNKSEAIEYHWLVDTTAPVVTLVSHQPDTFPTSRTEMSLVFSASETATFTCSLDGASALPCVSPYGVAGLPSGSHSISVTAKDSVGNTSESKTFNWIVDGVAPLITLGVVASPTRSTDASVTFSASEEATFTCSLDAGVAVPCTSPFQASGLAHGDHQLVVNAKDVAGNQAAPASRSWQVDTHAPVLSFGAMTPSGAITSLTSFSAVFSSEEGATYLCSLDGASAAACTSPFTRSGLSEGNHVLSVTAKDLAGNQSTALTHSWLVDTTVPLVTLGTLSPAVGLSSQKTFSAAFSSNEGGSFLCSLDAGTFTACASPFAISALSEGSHSFVVKAVDTAGNESAPASHSWVVDSVVPVVTLGAVNPATSPTSRTDISIVFSATEAGSFRCSLDGAASAACSAPFVKTGLADGAHTLSILALDAAQNQSAPVSYSWTVDTQAPALNLGAFSPAASPSSQRDFSIAFSSGETGSFQCALDGAAPQACTSPFTRSGLTEGTHTFSVTITDAAGNKSAPATRSWIIDGSAPTLTLGAIDPASSPTSRKDISIAFSANEAATFRCAIDGGAAQACTSPFSRSALSDGNHSVAITGQDAAGNQSSVLSYSWIVDNSAPVVTLGTVDPATSPVNRRDLSIAFSASEAGSTFRCSLDGGTAAVCTSPYTRSLLAEGSHTVSITAQDAAGNQSAAVTRTWVVDTTAPTVSLGAIDPAATLTSRADVSVSFTASETATFVCAVDGGAASACASPFQASGLANGSHQVSITAKDTAGNTGNPVSYQWTVDRTAPVVTLGAPNPSSSPTTQTSFSISFSANEASTFRCAFDGSSAQACSSPFSRSALGSGSHTVSITAVDAAGNTSAMKSYSWVIDLTAPVVSLQSASPSVSPSSLRTFSASFAASEASQTFCSLDGSAFAPCASPFTASNLGNGAHSFSVYATDTAGNQGQAVGHAWTVDAVAPVATILSTNPPGSTTYQTSITISFSANETSTFECKLDAGAAISCQQPFTATNLSDGVHTFSVTAIDTAGNRSAPATYQWTIDSTAFSSSSVTISQITQTSAKVTWTTSLPATSRLTYGPGNLSQSVVASSALAVSHSVILTGLTSNTFYTVQAVNTDTYGREAYSVPVASFRTGR